MAETKNTFTGSKMNQDLDARLLPNGQYRTAQNVAISKSEGDDVGALENILGNISVATIGLQTEVSGQCDRDMEIIGKYMDNANNRIFVFLTNYVDTSLDKISNPVNQWSEQGVDCYIACYNASTKTWSIIVGNDTSRGSWLNFSKTHPILGINLIEDLLFWTDNRNQPRKINVTTALGDPTYYSTEDHVSVAKYYPHKSLELVEDNGIPAFVNEISAAGTGYAAVGPTNVGTAGGGGSGLTVNIVATAGPVTTAAIHTPGSGYTNGGEVTILGGGNNAKIKVSTLHGTMQDVVSPYLPIHTAAEVRSGWVSAPGTTIDVLGPKYNIQVGDKVTGPTIDGECIILTLTQDAAFAPPRAYFTFSPAQTVSAGDPIYFQRRNPFYKGSWATTPPIPNWPGDPEYLKDKFVRFSYRFKFDDGEYSLIAPFTQTAYVPEQDGYFIKLDDEDNTYRSSIVNFMENKVNDITLVIPPPEDTQERNILFSNLNSTLKVVEIDILYKESDGKSIKVVDTIKEAEFQLWDSYGTYNYQSRRPIKTLPSDEITRVSDKVPVRALAQETAGNRIIYGNFIDGWSAPSSLNYTVSVRDKSTERSYWSTATAAEVTEPTGIRQEYQNHTLKQNRTYQVGIILCDRWGRQSDVILSNTLTTGDSINKGSTIFHPYKDSGYTPALITDGTGGIYSWDTWPGDALNVTFYDKIPETITESGYAGLYRYNEYEVEGLSGATTGRAVGDIITTTTTGAGSGMTVRVTSIVNLPVVGTVTGLEIADPGFGYSNNDTILLTSGAAGFTLGVTNGNRNGWYSYKIVVKQQEQDYYNVYLPGMLAGYPTSPNVNTGLVNPAYPTGVDDSIAHITLISDNINKVPRDLQEVGPEQKQFNSSIELYGRVENNIPTGAVLDSTQYYPGTQSDRVNIIGSLTDLSFGPGISGGTGYPIFPVALYNANTNPLIGRLSTRNQIGLNAATMSGPNLSVYETAPVKSAIDIFWETSTSGLISDLNWNIVNIDSTLPVALSTPAWSWTEASAVGDVITSTFFPVNANGADIGPGGAADYASVSLIAAINHNGRQLAGTDGFTLTPSASGYTLSITTPATGEYFQYVQDNGDNEWIFIFELTRQNISPASDTRNGQIIYMQLVTTLGNVAPVLTLDPVIGGTCATMNTDVVTNFNRYVTVEPEPNDAYIDPPSALTGFPSGPDNSSSNLFSSWVHTGGRIRGYTNSWTAGFDWSGLWAGANGSNAGGGDQGREVIFNIVSVEQLGIYGYSMHTNTWQFQEFQAVPAVQFPCFGCTVDSPYVTGINVPSNWQANVPKSSITVTDPFSDGFVFWGMHWWETDLVTGLSGANGMGYDPNDLSDPTNPPMMISMVTDTAGETSTQMPGYMTIPDGFPFGKYNVNFTVTDANNTGISVSCTLAVNVVPAVPIASWVNSWP